MSNIDNNSRYLIGVDVGTGSARAGVFDLTGHMLGVEKHDITLFSDMGARYEQSTQDIWHAVCESVKGAVRSSGIRLEQVAGISFDATCSMAVFGEEDLPIAVGEHGENNRNVIVWMDQRAKEQAKRINELGHSVLQFVGNKISPEMETPKLLWLKENLPETYYQAKYFFDLTDFLTWKASGSLARSICTTVCKWTYLAHEKRWDDSYFKQIGLGDLAESDFSKIGSHIVEPGVPLANGLTQESARELGLLPGTAVAAGLIDAHAGGVGSVGALDNNGQANPSVCMAYVFGTSACTLTSSPSPVIVPGVWGPYYSAMLPRMWLNEAGQSAAGAAIDHLLSMHPASAIAKKRAADDKMPLAAWLSKRARESANGLSDVVRSIKGLHVVPEFLGNRAPFADPNAKAIISGLDMDTSIDSLVNLYVAGVCGLAYGLRQIIEAQREKGLDIAKIVISGGAGQDPLVRQLLADATGVEVVAPKASEPVLLGTAMLAAVASKQYSDLERAMSEMSSFDENYQPSDGDIHQIHQSRFHAFCMLQALQRELNDLE